MQKPIYPQLKAELDAEFAQLVKRLEAKGYLGTQKHGSTIVLAIVMETENRTFAAGESSGTPLKGTELIRWLSGLGNLRWNRN